MTDEHDGPVPGSDQLQTAVRAVIDAARALLDVAEGLIADPAALKVVLSSVRDVAKESIASFVAMASAPSTGEPGSERIDVREEGFDG